MFRLREEQVAAMAKQFTAGVMVNKLQARGHQALRHEGTHDVHVTDAAGNVARFELDDQGRIAEGITPMGRRFRYGCDSQRRLNSIVDPAGSRVFCEFDDRHRIKTLGRELDRRLDLDWDKWGNLSRITFADRSCCEMNFRELDRFTSYRDRLGRTSRFERNDAGLLTEIVDAKGNRTRFDYQQWNLPACIALADGSREEIAYDAAGRVSAAKINGNPWAELAWHAPGKIADIRCADGHFANFVYDAAGNVMEAKNPSSVVKRKFDEQNRLLEEEQNGRMVRYGYDALGHLTSITTPFGDTVKFGYDADGRLTCLEDWNGGRHRVEHEAENNVQRHHLPNSLTVLTRSASSNLAAEIRTTGFADACEELSLRFEHNLNGQVVKVDDSDCGVRRLTYDSEGQLLGVQNFAGFADERFRYDENGNRVGANSEEAEFDSVNQLKRQGDLRFVYDARGNLIEQRGPNGTTRYIYNRQNQLTAMKRADGRVIEFAYDAFARRISKKSARVETHYLWAGDQLICEWTEGGANPEKRDYLFFPGTHKPLSLRVNGEVYQYHNDHLGSPRWLTDNNGRVVWSACYSAFGTATIRSNRLAQSLRFPGQYFDEETGLHYNRARYYSPALGRYLSRDPIQVVSNLNLYLYAGNDPVNGSDPLGLLGFWNAVIGGALIVGAVALAVVAAPVLLTAGGLLMMVGAAALAGAGAGVLMAPDNCPMCMLQAGLKGLAYGAGLGLMAAGLLIGGPPAAGFGALALAGGGMLATDAALVMGGATFGTGVLMMSNASKMSDGGSEGSGESDGSEPKPRNRKWRTEPTGEPGGEPTGEPTELKPGDNAETKRSIWRERESAQRLADAGYRVEQNPEVLPTDNVAPGKNPDLRVEGEIFDCYSPATSDAGNIVDRINMKVADGQADRIVLNLQDSSVSRSELRQALMDQGSPDLKEIIAIDQSGNIIRFFP